MTDTTERAELLADREAFIEAHHKHLDLTEVNDAWGRPMFRHSHVEAMWDGWKKGRDALRRLAAQDQKPVAHQLRVKDGSYCRIIPDGELEEWKINWANHLARGHAEIIPLGPLYLSPPPAAGWYEAIEAATRICHEAAAETDGNASRGAMAEELASSIEALRTTPAATKSSDAGGGVQEQLDEALAENKVLRAANTKLVLAERDRSESALTNQPLAVDSIGQRWRTELDEIIGHLGAAVSQSIATDDQIIMDHVKAAHEIAKVVRRQA